MHRAIRVLAAAALAVGVVGFAAPAKAGSETGNFMVRLLAAGVLPDDTVDVTAGALFADSADVSDAWVPATTLTYFLNPNLSLELLCCVAQHEARATGALAGLGEVGEMWIFPPTVTLQYHFTGLGSLKPYIGAGVTYIVFFDEQARGGLAAYNLEVDDAWGFTLQAGLDVSLGGGWYLNADVKKVFLDTDATWTPTAGAPITADIELDPWIVSFGVGYRFNLGDLFGRAAPPSPLK
jgi:outer membrane protein